MYHIRQAMLCELHICNNHISSLQILVECGNFVLRERCYLLAYMSCLMTRLIVAEVTPYVVKELVIIAQRRLSCDRLIPTMGMLNVSAIRKVCYICSDFSLWGENTISGITNDQRFQDFEHLLYREYHIDLCSYNWRDRPSLKSIILLMALESSGSMRKVNMKPIPTLECLLLILKKTPIFPKAHFNWNAWKFTFPETGVAHQL